MSSWVAAAAWLRDQSKRDSSTAQADNFAGAKLGKKRRLASLGMTGLGGLAEIVAKISGCTKLAGDFFLE
jgi:hypothetical protein